LSHTDGSYSGSVGCNAASCWPLQSNKCFFCKGNRGPLLPWSFRTMRGDQKPGTPQWIVSPVRNVVQDLFWHPVSCERMHWTVPCLGVVFCCKFKIKNTDSKCNYRRVEEIVGTKFILSRSTRGISRPFFAGNKSNTATAFPFSHFFLTLASVNKCIYSVSTRPVSV